MKELTKKQLEWCEKYLMRGKWKVNSHGRVDVESDVFFCHRYENRKLEKFPIEFGKVTGRFDCSGCTSLTSLEGAPQVVTKSFDCHGCTSLTSLEGAPQRVTRGFDCRGCTSLTSLEGAPQKNAGGFYCDGCTSLDPLHLSIVTDYNDDKIDWPTAYKLIHRPKLSKAYSLGLI